jgi:hypothetical protein
VCALSKGGLKKISSGSDCGIPDQALPTAGVGSRVFPDVADGSPEDGKKHVQFDLKHA